MVLITIMEHLPPLRSLGLSLSPRSSHSSPSTDCSLFYLSPFLSLDSRLALLCRAYAPLRSRPSSLSHRAANPSSAIFHPLFRPSTLASIKWISQTKNSNKPVGTSPLQSSAVPMELQRSSRKRTAPRTRTASPMARGKEEKVTHHIAGALPLHPLRRHDATRDDAKRSVDAGTTLRVRSIARNSRESSSTALQRERKRKREPREKFRTSLSEIYRRRGRNKSMARDARERGWR